MKNPFGNDFIRLEVDADRFRHNKTGSGGIHHIPLIVNGYPDIVEKTKLVGQNGEEKVAEKSMKLESQDANRLKRKSNKRGHLQQPTEPKQNIVRKSDTHQQQKSNR